MLQTRPAGPTFPHDSNDPDPNQVVANADLADLGHLVRAPVG